MPPLIDPRGTAEQNYLYTPSHISYIGLKCFSELELSIALTRFIIFVTLPKISELTINFFKKEIDPGGLFEYLEFIYSDYWSFYMVIFFEFQ